MIMAIYAISDLHLSHGTNKPMDVFGANWAGYVLKIKDNWESMITEFDTVLIPGDISWAMQMCDAYEDFMFIEKLPGTKIILKGNHDYWWDTASKINRFFSLHDISSIKLLHNNSYDIDGVSVFGTRGWLLPGSGDFGIHDRKIYEREKERFKLSFGSCSQKNERRIVMTHYPPFARNGEATEITDMIAATGAGFCVFGHVHSDVEADLYDRVIDGVRYMLVSCDHLGFIPASIRC